MHILYLFRNVGYTSVNCCSELCVDTFCATRDVWVLHKRICDILRLHAIFEPHYDKLAVVMQQNVTFSTQLTIVQESCIDYI